MVSRIECERELAIVFATICSHQKMCWFKQEVLGTEIILDEAIDDDGASQMAQVIQKKMRLTLTPRQIRQISTIISDQKEMTRPNEAGNANATIPSIVARSQLDNSSESITSTLTYASQAGRVTTDSENRKTYKSFTDFTHAAHSKGTLIDENTNGVFNSEGQIRFGDNVAETEEKMEEISSKLQMPPPSSKKAQSEGEETRKEIDTTIDNDFTRVEEMNVAENEQRPLKKKEEEIISKRHEHHQYDGSGYNAMVEKTYCTSNYLSTRPNAPKECAKCKVSFTAENKQYLVGTKKTVHACPNARDMSSECMHALCNGCYLPEAVDFADTKKGGEQCIQSRRCAANRNNNNN